jgi:hypothetical protein
MPVLKPITKDQYIDVLWHDGQRNRYRVAEDSSDGDVVGHRWIEHRQDYASWTANVPRNFIVAVVDLERCPEEIT